MSTDSSNLHLVDRSYVYGPSGTTVHVTPGRPVTLILVSVKQGSVDLFIGPTASSAVPDLHFGQSNEPVCVPWFAGQAPLTFVADGPGKTVASVILGGP